MRGTKDFCNAITVASVTVALILEEAKLPKELMVRKTEEEEVNLSSHAELKVKNLGAKKEVAEL